MKSSVKAVESEYVLCMFPSLLTPEEMPFHIVMHRRSTIQRPRLGYIGLQKILIGVREQPSNGTQEILVSILAQRFALL